MNKVISNDRSHLHRMLPLFRIAVLALAFAGCAGRTPVLPLTFYDSPEAALRALAATGPGALAVTATTRIEIHHNGNRYPVKVALMMKRPALLRVESIPLMGSPDFYLSVAEGELRVFLPGKGAFYTGRATPRNISRFFPISLTATDIVSLLMGLPPDDSEEMQSLRGDREEGLYRIDYYQSGRRMRSLWIEPAEARLIRFKRFTDEGTAVYAADFADYVRFGEGYLPRQVTIREGETSILTVRQTDVQQTAADPESFPLPVPAGLIPILLDP